MRSMACPVPEVMTTCYVTRSWPRAWSKTSSESILTIALIMVLRGLILNAAQVVKADPRAEAQYRVLDRTYLHPAPSQERAAELLDLSFSTYRRYRDRGIEAITEWLWDHDVDSCVGCN
jgi:hypothetical protein